MARVKKHSAARMSPSNPLDLLVEKTKGKKNTAKKTNGGKPKTTGGTATHCPLGIPGPVSTSVELSPAGAPALPQSSQDSVLPAVVLPKKVRTGRPSSVQPGDLWCSLCGNGHASSVTCSKCGRSNCPGCIPELAGMEKEELDSCTYECPTCCGRRNIFYGLWKGDAPVFPQGMTIADTAKGDHGVRYKSSSVIVLEFIMASVAGKGTPALALHVQLQGFFSQNPQDLKYRCVPFDVDPSNLEPHREKVARVVNLLNRENFDQAILIVHTHSDKERGDLMYCGDGNTTSQSTGISDFFEKVIGPDLREYFQSRKYSMMVLAACGSVVRIPAAREELREVANSFKFADTFAFSEADLDPYRITPFITEFVMNVLVTGRPSKDTVPTALSLSSTLHYTGVVHLQWTETGVEMERFERVHPTARPNGGRFPLQCKICHAYRPWVVPKATKKRYNIKQVFKCGTKKCSGFLVVRRLKGYRPLPDRLDKIFAALISLP
ncbi:hypothetical protein BJ322DRAFT_1103899 [Thelephora terrestris]|uniref:RING-type domain-containing protein n=1 Tax=Thelephora terrestris TaxID=56493 RepID=A0A9P6LEE1_9AGAM|nr:hypothetical protein BJ322DRAFT_1103899 [Thelephora terrestris]